MSAGGYLRNNAAIRRMRLDLRAHTLRHDDRRAVYRKPYDRRGGFIAARFNAKYRDRLGIHAAHLDAIMRFVQLQRPEEYLTCQP